MSGWACTNGGSSDTRIWAEHGIQSVNLSVGYGNEHTEEEYLDVEAAYGTVKLIKGVFENSRELCEVVRGLTGRTLLRDCREWVITVQEPDRIVTCARSQANSAWHCSLSYI